MSGLSTKDVQTGGGIPKTISPGEHVLKINNVGLSRPSFERIQQEEGYYVVLNVETKPIPDFEGFFIDKENESLGKYEGQVGEVKTSKFYYKDGETKSGVKITRDLEILKQIKNICIATDTVDWFDAADGKYPTIEAFVDGFNKEKPYANKYLKFCVAGKEFSRNNGYIGHDMFLPKLTRGVFAFEAEDAAQSKLMQYNASEHLEKLQQTQVSSFEAGADEPAVAGVDDDFPVDPAEEAPEFDL